MIDWNKMGECEFCFRWTSISETGELADHLRPVADKLEKCFGSGKTAKLRVLAPLVPLLESDSSYRDRICEALPAGYTHTAEDLGDSVGEQLDAIGKSFGIERHRLK